MLNACLKICFWLIVKPLSMLLKAIGADPLHKRLLPKATTYWEKAGNE